MESPTMERIIEAVQSASDLSNDELAVRLLALSRDRRFDYETDIKALLVVASAHLYGDLS